MSSQSSAADGTVGKVQKEKLFRKDFVLVVFGQIISLFGNAILRFALPLYILDQSGSPALFGIISATAFIPMILMSPIGGIFADRVNKQRIMVVLDFITAGLILGFILLSGRVALAPLVVVFMMLLYAISGAYQPAVQASMPILAKGENLVPANAIINLVNSLAGLLGPVLGGLLYGTYGLSPILTISCGCFVFSAVMELFIRIPHKPQAASGGVFAIVKSDMSQSMRFILREQPIMAKVIVLIFGFNLFLSSMLVIGLPVLITQNLGMGSELYGFSQGAMAVGGLLGGLTAGVFGNKLDIRNSWTLLAACALGLVPMAIVMLPGVPAFASYLVLTIMSALLMIGATMFSIQMLAFAQVQTPVELVGKVVSCLMALSMCAQPIGQAMYGLLFERLAHLPWAIILGAAVVSCGIAVYSRSAFRKLK